MDDFDSNTTDEDLSLPKATVKKLIDEMMDKDISIAKETRDLISDCCVEFIHLLASEANEICEKEAKKTIAGDHVLSALKSLGFEEYLEEVQEVNLEHSQQQKEREKRNAKMKDSGMSNEELLKSQEELFAQAKLRLQQQNVNTSGEQPFV
ncbi:negative cofactor 2 transcription regulator complex subunit ncb2 [Clydaea vesicula]|uniref:Negative cofactor 2 transcription regulator complex subunit ncb2 n=1 Tax=Clydaea vesicula TaxID=447962 RepID=A0AAD5U839_9FUNG|nr:negative cofactor 2 transcription regulator complex subunit ncb2 [Clydaea vesicula]